MIGHAVRFEFIGVAGLAYVELRLDLAGIEKPQHGLIPEGTVQLESRKGFAETCSAGIRRFVLHRRR